MPSTGGRDERTKKSTFSSISGNTSILVLTRSSIFFLSTTLVTSKGSPFFLTTCFRNKLIAELIDNPNSDKTMVASFFILLST